ncbi:MAG: putative sensor domain DACNV-containing protein [Thermodesulfobacteriota bacterium]
MASEYPLNSYPRDLARFVRNRWQAVDVNRTVSLPGESILEHLISVSYQTSLLREEERPIRFRLIFMDPDRFPSDHAPAVGLHNLLLRDMLPFTVRELRKLSPAVDFYGSLIGLWHAGRNGLSIWGIVHSGPQWAQSLHGGGKGFQPLPDSLVISVTNPGRMTISNGSTEIATLFDGKIVCPSTAVFDSIWIRSEFSSIVDEELALHREARKCAKKPWAAISPDFFGTIKKQAFMRIIGRIRSYRHGGTVFFIPDELKEQFLSENPYAKLKYRFVVEESRRRFRTLIVELANELAEFYGTPENPERMVGWSEYLAKNNQTLSRLDESVFEWAHLVAGMTQVDGAVFITQRMELIGFGAQISGKLERVDEVAIAYDSEGIERRKELTDGVGTRHYSAYSLCNALRNVVAIVVSQDGTAQLIKWTGNMVTVWKHLSSSLIEG